MVYICIDGYCVCEIFDIHDVLDIFYARGLQDAFCVDDVHYLHDLNVVFNFDDVSYVYDDSLKFLSNPLLTLSCLHFC